MSDSQFTPEPDDTEDEVRPQFAIQTVSAEKMKSQLSAIFPKAGKFDDVLPLAGKPAEIFPLALAAEFFLSENQLDDYMIKGFRPRRTVTVIMQAMVPKDQHARLKELMRELGRQLMGQ